MADLDKKMRKMAVGNEKEKTIVEPPVEFDGKGQHGGWKFRRVAATEHGYVYERSSPDVCSKYYEVFRRVVRKARTVTFPSGSVKDYPKMVVYPGDSAFGEWAWCCGTLERAMEILASFEREVIKKQ